MSDEGQSAESEARVRRAEIDLGRDVFMRTLVGHLSETLQDVVGIQEAEGFVSVVGQKIGEEINESYCRGLAVDRLSRPEVAAVLVDLKRRIQGDFYIVEEDEDRIVLGNRACPFGDKVKGRPALCMMTSNVFGVIAAENLGYARIGLEKTIAQGDAQCRVVIHLSPGSKEEVHATREYYRE